MVLGDQDIKISLPLDNGFLGRECPNPDCLGYFKIKPGTGITQIGYEVCYCPYCDHKATQKQFYTEQQNKYILSVAKKKLMGIIEKKFKKLDRDLRRSTRNGLVQLRVDFKSSHHSIAYYAEKDLQTEHTCKKCGLEYAVYGKFAFCPDCGAGNSDEVFEANLDLINRMLQKADQESDTLFKEYLVKNSLEDIVSVFDSFGRNSVRLTVANSSLNGYQISFQNIQNARDKVLKDFGFDIFDSLNSKEIQNLVVGFQKRHLISHQDGIIDEKYIRRSKDRNAQLGHKVEVSSEDVKRLILLVRTISSNLLKGLDNWNKRQTKKTT